MLLLYGHHHILCYVIVSILFCINIYYFCTSQYHKHLYHIHTGLCKPVTLTKNHLTHMSV